MAQVMTPVLGVRAMCECQMQNETDGEGEVKV